MLLFKDSSLPLADQGDTKMYETRKDFHASWWIGRLCHLCYFFSFSFLPPEPSFVSLPRAGNFSSFYPLSFIHCLYTSKGVLEGFLKLNLGGFGV